MLLVFALGGTVARAAEPLRVAYAGSMGVVMDSFLGPAFAAEHGVEYQGIGQGAYGLARQLAGRVLQADVFIAITPGPIAVVREAGLIGAAVPVASTEMVIAYSPKSRFAAEFAAVAQGKKPWYEVLATPGLRFGRTDPATDPQGQNIIFTMLLAEQYYKQPNLAAQLLGPAQNPAQLMTEPSLLSRLEAGQIDASSGYRSAVLSHHLPYITLPDQINLGDPTQQDKWYRTVQFDLPDPAGAARTLHTQPLVFYAAVLNDSKQAALAEQFVRFVQSVQGQKILAQNGYGPARGPALP
ncbi:MAG: extracellular solute-binding protein [Pseudomonadota bacterium]|nr:extracellular solute-binding protein [Pseudomonadota bacterium]